VTGLEHWLKVNADFASGWPNITNRRNRPSDAKKFDGAPEKARPLLLCELASR
jgi:ferredoxin